MSQFHVLLAGGSNSSGLLQVRIKMCPEGRELFKKFCGNPDKYPQFIVHIEKENEECLQCREVFLDYLWFVTDGNSVGGVRV
jgi:hypothetical protein